MDKAKAQLLINNIDWNKNWEDLTWDEKANYLSLKQIPFLHTSMEDKVIKLFNKDSAIVSDRGTENLWMYL